MTPTPIMPDRFPSDEPIALDDANKAAARAFRANALAAGHAVAAEDGVTILRPKSKGRTPPPLEVVSTDDADDEPTPAPPLPAYLELDSGESEHVIAIARRGKPPIELHPVITLGSTRKNGWFQRQIERLSEEAATTDDEARFDAIAARVSELQHAMVRLSIPNLPDGLLDEISPAQFTGLMVAMERIGEEIGDESRRIAGKLRGQH